MSNSQQDVAPFLVALEDRVDISRAEAIFAKFEDALQRSEPIAIDVSGVERIDTSGFQILISFCRALEKSGRKTHLTAVSEVFQNNAKLLGLENYLPSPLQ